MRINQQRLRAVFVFFFIYLWVASCESGGGGGGEEDETLMTTMFGEDLGGKHLLYPKYTYKRSGHTENRLKSLSNACATKTECFNIRSSPGSTADKQNCILRCVSPACYDAIYAFDPLEDGEIDQRFTSYKGCFSTSSHKDDD